MKFTSLLSTLIVEQSKFKVLYDKFVLPQKPKEGEPKSKNGLVDFETYKAIILSDPTTIIPRGLDKDIDELTVEDMENIKVGKYTQWMLKTLLKPSGITAEPGTPEYKRQVSEYKHYFLEDLQRLKDLLSKYDRFKSSIKDVVMKNIDNVKSVEELSTLPIVVGDDGETVELELYRGKKPKVEKGVDTKKSYAFPGSEILKVGDQYTLIRISDKGELGSKAASFFGGYHNVDKGESNWCTSPEGSSYSQNYRQDGPLYIILANDDKGQVGEVTGLPQERYQIHFPSNQFRNRQNREIEFTSMLNDGPFKEFKEIFKPEFAKGLTSKSGDQVNIEYPNSSAGKFIVLYGFEQLFTSLPDTITQLKIYNKSKDKIALDVPPTVSRFKRLETLLLDNIVRTLPENLGDLQDLMLLSLQNNEELVSIPESVMKIPDLAIISLKNSNPNIKLPKEMLDIEPEDGLYILS